MNFADKLRLAFGIEVVDKTDLEKYCDQKYTPIKNFAYSNKRAYKGMSYPVFLNEMITPNAFMIKKDLLKGVLIVDDMFRRVRGVGNVVAKRLTWTSDKDTNNSDDYYLYPSEVLTSNKGDCEDHAFVMCSALPKDVGVAYGFYREGGHAFNVMYLDGELWVVDTVGDEVVTIRYEGQRDYIINYIITPQHTYAVDASVKFGDIAGWDS